MPPHAECIGGPLDGELRPAYSGARGWERTLSHRDWDAFAYVLSADHATYVWTEVQPA
jgi:hypothetical protein